jgi:hypothetical protein
MKRYKKKGLYLELPEDIKVKSHAPHFFAESKKHYKTIAIEFGQNHDEESYKFMLQDMQGTLGQNDSLESKEIFSGTTEQPFLGWIRIVEHRVIATGEVNHGLCFLGKLETNGQVVEIYLDQEGPYEESREDWEILLKSIFFD